MSTEIQTPAPAQPPAASEGAEIMQLIARSAADPAFDVTKLEKLMDLQKRLLNRKARGLDEAIKTRDQHFLKPIVEHMAR